MKSWLCIYEFIKKKVTSSDSIAFLSIYMWNKNLLTKGESLSHRDMCKKIQMLEIKPKEASSISRTHTINSKGH